MSNAPTATAGGSPSALVVEDDAVTRMMLVQALSDEGFVVAQAEDGHAALERFAEQPPPIVLMDVIMPGMNGFEACEAIREQADFSDVAVLMLTGLDDMESIDRAFRTGATDFITKPINWGLLRQRVRYALRLQRMQSEIRRNEARLTQAQRVARVAHWEYAPEYASFQWSAGMRELLDLAETSAREWLPGRIHAEDRSAIQEGLDTALHNGSAYTAEHRILLDDQEERTVLVRGEPSGDGERWVGVVQDITDIRRTEARLRYVTRFDAVTGLPNRDSLLEHLDQAMLEADIRQTSVALMVFDLERHQAVHESMGTAAADTLLRLAAERLTAHFGSEIIVARVGDAEFALLAGRIQRGEEAARLALTVQELLAEPFMLEGQEIYAWATVGITLYPTDAAEGATLLKNAGSAMRNSRDEGRGPYCFYTADMNARVMQELSLEGALRRALEERQFILYYQPQLDAAREETVGFEALLRWDHPDYGIVSPGAFIPLLESTGLITGAGRWLLEEAGRQCQAWNAGREQPVRVAINLSAQQFDDPELLPTIRRAIAGGGLTAESLELEITETVAMRDPQASLATLRTLKEMGFTIAIDDFGTGYSSLSYLKQLPLDKLKIDKSFVFDMHTSNDDAAIVRSTIHLAHDLGLRVVAEGVEEAVHVEMLRDMGCDILQGFHYGRPRPAPEAEAFLPSVGTDNQS